MSSAPIAGMLTAVVTTPPVSAATTCSAALVAGAVGRLGGRGAEVRRDDDVGVAEQRVLGDRLGAEDVERGAADLAGVERVLQRRRRRSAPPRATLRTRTPSRILANASALSQPSVSGVLGRWIVMKSACGVDARRELVGLLDAELAVALGADERVEGDDAHAEALRALRRRAGRCGRSRGCRASCPYSSTPENFERSQLAVDVSDGVRLRDVAREREQQRHRVLGGGDDVGLAARWRRRCRAWSRPATSTLSTPDAGAADRLQRSSPARSARPSSSWPSGSGCRRSRRCAARSSLVVQSIAEVDVEVLAQQRRRRSRRSSRRRGRWRHRRSCCSTTQSMHAVSACTSSGSIAGNMPMRSWLRPSLR